MLREQRRYAMTDNTTELARLIDEKLEIVSEVLTFARRQETVIAEQQVAELMPLLAKKQMALERLSGVQKALEPFASQDPERRVWASEKARQRCREREQQCDQLLRHIMELDAKCEGKLTESRDELAERLQQTTGTQQAARAYQASQAATGSRGGRLDLTAG